MQASIITVIDWKISFAEYNRAESLVKNWFMKAQYESLYQLTGQRVSPIPIRQKHLLKIKSCNHNTPDTSNQLNKATR